MENNQTIHWYPGHMTKAKRQIEADLKLVDIVVELVDSRIPISSRNPDFDTLLGQKKRLIVFNKADMADREATKNWISYYREKGVPAIAVDCKTGTGLHQVIPTIETLLSEEIERKEARGIKAGQIKMMVVGIPNVGKSSFINKLTGRKTTKVEDRPGVTRGKQWVKLSAKIELLDTPGVLWGKIEDQRAAERLAFTGAIKDNVIDIELLAVRLLEILSQNSKKALCERYKIDETAFYEGAYETLEAIAKKRGMLMSGGHIDTERASIMLLDEFRGLKLGKITLELPEDVK